MNNKTMRIVNSPKDIPNFKSALEEQAFWAKHEVGEGMITDEELDLSASLTRSYLRPTTQISLKLERDTKERLEKVAKAKNIPYQTLLKTFVSERLYEEEKRLGIVK
jgi:predicted DNA binding CopG/RHH family protein